MTHRHTVMQRGLLPVSIALALAPALAGAQEATPAPAENATTLDRIEVTGSRIRQSDIETAQPVIQVTRQQIQQQGFTSVADILQNLTSAGSPAISRAQALASGEDVGGYYIDIRNLGAQRTDYTYADYDGLYFDQPDGEPAYARLGFRLTEARDAIDGSTRPFEPAHIIRKSRSAGRWVSATALKIDMPLRNARSWPSNSAATILMSKMIPCMSSVT